MSLYYARFSKSTEGLSSYEIAALVSIMENRLTPDTAVAPSEIQQDMWKAGYTQIAINLSLESLKRKGMIEFEEREADLGGTYSICKITQEGVDWLLENQERFRLRVEETPITGEDVPS